MKSPRLFCTFLFVLGVSLLSAGVYQARAQGLSLDREPGNLSGFGVDSGPVKTQEDLQKRHKVTLYDGGVAVREWHSGSVEIASSCAYFTDDSAVEIVVCGNFVVETE